MILYLDASALVKHYFLEEFSGDVIAIWQSADQVVTSFVAYGETMACIYRKQRGGLSPDTTSTIVSRFKNDWESLIRVKVNADLCGQIDKLVEAHALRGFDAIHPIQGVDRKAVFQSGQAMKLYKALSFP